MASGLENKDLDSVFNILLQNQCNIRHSFMSKFSNFELALFVFWQSYLPLPRLVDCLVKKKSQWNLEITLKRKKKILVLNEIKMI